MHVPQADPAQLHPDRDRNLEAADRLVRAAAAAGAELIVLPEKWPVLGTPEQTAAEARSRSTARRSPGPAAPRAGWASTSSPARSRARGGAQERGANTSIHIGPDGEDRATYRKIHMFDVEVGRARLPRVRARGARRRAGHVRARQRRGARPDHLPRPPLPGAVRILAIRGATVIAVLAAFTETTTRDHWAVLLRARAIEDQCFVVAANQVGEPAPGIRTGRRSMIVDPWGIVLAQAPDSETFVVAELDFERLRGIRSKLPSLANRQAAAYRWPAEVPAVKQAAAEKRRLILDAAVRVFARRGFHTCRVSDIADEAGVAYGLVYHCFQSKDEVLDTLFLERWELMLAAIDEIDTQPISARDKLYAIASFIVDSYRHDRDLMKVIIVEVTRAADTFGQTHLPEIRRRTSGSLTSSRRRRPATFRDAFPTSSPRWRSTAPSSRCSPAGSSGCWRRGWTTTSAPSATSSTPSSRPRSASRRDALELQRHMTDNDMVKRLMWSGLLAALGALAIATTKVAHAIWVRAFGKILQSDRRQGQAGRDCRRRAGHARVDRRTRAGHGRREEADQAARTEAEARGAELREELAITDERRAEEEQAKAEEAVAAAEKEASKKERKRREAEERKAAATAEAERARDHAENAEQAALTADPEQRRATVSGRDGGRARHRLGPEAAAAATMTPRPASRPARVPASPLPGPRSPSCTSPARSWARSCSPASSRRSPSNARPAIERPRSRAIQDVTELSCSCARRSRSPRRR